MVKKFEAVMSKLAVLGHDTRSLIDCSEVIPVPSTAKAQSAFLPAGKTLADIQGAVCISLCIMPDCHIYTSILV